MGIIASRRGLAIALCAVLGLAACGGDSDDGASRDATFVMARTGDIDMLDPHKATAFQTRQALELIYDTLVEVDADGGLQPGLAESWEYSDDGLTLTLTLREGVQFHDGAELGSDDVKASIERVLDEKTAAVQASNVAVVERIDTPDPHTVTIELTQPSASLLYALADVGQAIVDAPAAGEAELTGDPNGTGPFRYVSRRPGSNLVLGANREHWAGAPSLSRIEIRVIPDEASVLAGLRAGTVHLGVLTDPRVIRQVDEDRLEVVEADALAYHALMLNGRRGALSDPAVRQAISCAIDRQQVIDTAAFGQGSPTGPITSPAFETDPTAGLPCTPPDPDAARAMLQDAGASGLELDTIVMTGGYVTAVDEAQNLQAQLKAVGVDLKLERLETNAYVKRWLEADFDAAVALNSGDFDPYITYNRYFTEDGSLAKPAGHGSARLDELLKAGGRETDEDRRREIFAEFSQELLTASPWTWLFTGSEYRVLQKEVRGFELKPNGSMKSLREVSLEGS